MKFEPIFTRETEDTCNELQFVLTPETPEEKALVGAAHILNSVNAVLNNDGQMVVSFYNEA
jgi:hypothetical protein